MNSRTKLAAAVAIGCAFLLAVLSAAAFVTGAGLEGQEQALLTSLVERRLGALLMIVFVAGVFLFLI